MEAPYPIAFLTHVRTVPRSAICSGALILGYFLNTPRCSSAFMMIGIVTIPGAAIPILDSTTLFN